MSYQARCMLSAVICTVLVMVTLLSLVIPLRADNTTGSDVNRDADINDTPSDFEGKGKLISIDTDPAAGNENNPSLNAPFFDVSKPAPVPPAMDTRKWTFEIKHSVEFWGPATGANFPRIGIRGVHRIGPDNPPEIDVLNQPLPFVQSKRGSPQNIVFGKKQKLTVTTFTDHDLNPRLFGSHTDMYSVTMEDAEAKADGVNRKLEGNFKIKARHIPDTKNNVSRRMQKGFGSNPATVSYDAVRGTLSFDIGAIDILDSNGGLTGGIEPRYAGDPILAAQWTVSDLRFSGRQSDGRFKFSGGEVTLTDPAGKFTFDATFSEYFISDTTGANLLTSFGLLQHLSISDVAEEVDGPSRFLQDFIDTNLHGVSIPKSELDLIQGIDFALVTTVNIAQITGGFTQSVSNIPATYIISANGTDPGTNVNSLIDLKCVAGCFTYHTDGGHMFPQYPIEVTVKNTGNAFIVDPIFEVVVLDGPSCNGGCTVDGFGGVGARIPINVGADGRLAPGETVPHRFVINLTRHPPQRFDFFVNVLGMVGEDP